MYSSKQHNLNDVDLLMHMQNTGMLKLEEQEASNLEGLLTFEEAV